MGSAGKLNSEMFSRFLISILVLTASNCARPAAQNPVADRVSVFDLRLHETIDKPFALIGFWEFHWRRLASEIGITPNADHAIVAVPGPWRKAIQHPGEHRIERTGFGTYVTTVLLSENQGDLALEISEISGAYNLYVNDELVDSQGVVAGDSKSAVDRFLPTICKIPTAEMQLRIAIEVSNHANLEGGIVGPIILGSYEQLSRKRTHEIWITLLMIGSFLFLGLYHLVWFAIRPADIAPGYFALLCLAMAGFLFSNGSLAAQDSFSWIGYESIIRSIYMSTALASFGLIGYAMHTIQPVAPRASLSFLLRPIIQRKNTAIGVFALLYCMAAILSPLDYLLYVLLSFTVLNLLWPTIALYYLGRTIRRSEPASIFAFASYSILFFGFLHDLFYYLYLAEISIWPWTLLIFAVYQSYDQFSKFNEAFKVREEMVALLHETNVKLLEQGRELQLSHFSRDQERTHSREALTKLKERFNTDLHDHLGSQLLDLKFRILALEKEIGRESPMIRSARDGIDASIQSMYEQMTNLDDIEYLSREFVTGLRTILLRRYSSAGREVRLKFDDSLLHSDETGEADSSTGDPIDQAKIIEIYSIIQETTSNDLKYGFGKSLWELSIANWQGARWLQFALKANSSYAADQGMRIGRGRGNLSNRVKAIQGTIDFKQTECEYEQTIRIPWHKRWPDQDAAAESGNGI